MYEGTKCSEISNIFEQKLAKAWLNNKHTFPVLKMIMIKVVKGSNQNIYV
jgi:hypothetical protein